MTEEKDLFLVIGYGRCQGNGSWPLEVRILTEEQIAEETKFSLFRSDWKVYRFKGFDVSDQFCGD